MAVKDLRNYYNKVCNDYKEMLDEIKIFEKELEQKIVPPEAVDNMKRIIEPLLANYQQISYIMYLLNMPNKNSKKEKYKNQQKKMIQGIEKENTTEAKLAINKEVLERLKSL